MKTADKIDLLFTTITKPDGSSYSYQDIATMGGDVVSRTSIWKARTGKIENPSQRLLGVLSKAFRVPVRYFFEEEIAAEDIPRYLEEYRNERLIDQIALRATELNEEGKEALLQMIDYVRNSHK